MNKSQTATSIPQGVLPRVSFSSLPLEVKEQIVKLVDEQDEKYRQRMRWPATRTTKHTASGGSDTSDNSDSGCYGKGINQLALCTHELGDLASQCLYSDLSEQIAENLWFPFWILPRYKDCFRSITLPASDWMDYTFSSNDTFPSVLLALPHLSNLTKIIIDGDLTWIGKFTRGYNCHPFLCVAEKLRHLEFNWSYNLGDTSDAETNAHILKIVHEQDMLLVQLFETVYLITSLLVNVFSITDELLNGIGYLTQLKDLTLEAEVVRVNPMGQKDFTRWKECKSLRCISINIFEARWNRALVLWIKSSAMLVETLTIIGCSCGCGCQFNTDDKVGAAQDSVAGLALSSFCLPSLSHLSISFCRLLDLKTLEDFQSPCLTYVSVNDSLEFRPSDDKRIAVSKHSLDMVDIADLWKSIQEAEASKSEGFDAQVHEMVRDFSKLRGYRFRYKTPTSTSTSETNTLETAPGNTSPADLENLEQSVMPLLSYATRAVKQIVMEGNSRASKELLDALNLLKGLKERDKE